jgi:hypothetical protein
MKKEDVEVIARLLTSLKDSMGELESSLKRRSSEDFVAAKRKIIDLQMQIGRKL